MAGESLGSAVQNKTKGWAYRKAAEAKKLTTRDKWQNFIDLLLLVLTYQSASFFLYILAASV